MLIIYNLQNIQEYKMIKPDQSQKSLGVGQVLVNKKYTLIHKLYESPTSKIFVGAFMKNGKQVSRVIKMQPTNSDSLGNNSKKSNNLGIKNQINFLRHLFMNEEGKIQPKVGFPHMFQYGVQKNHNYVVTSMYGPNLAQLMKLCGGRFSARTTLLVALQIIDRLEDIHNKRYLYGGICPQNFIIGTGKESFLIYVIDFGKSTVYKSKSKNVHIPYQHRSPQDFLNTDNHFTSINCQLGVQQSRRDDIQSFMYLILYMFKGKLPWTQTQRTTYVSPTTINIADTGQENKQRPSISFSINNLSSTSNQENRVNALQIKRGVSPESLFKSLSFQLIDLLHYVRTLSFYQRPDYAYIRQKLWSALMETDYQQLRNNIIVYDWNQRESLDYQIYREFPRFKLISESNQKDAILQQYKQAKSDRGSERGSSQDLNKSSKRSTQKQMNRSNIERRPLKKLSGSGSLKVSDKIGQKLYAGKNAQGFSDDANITDEDCLDSIKSNQKTPKEDESGNIFDSFTKGFLKNTKAPQNSQSRFKS